MPGTRKGALKAAATNRAKYGDDFYSKRAEEAQAAWRANGRKPRGFAVKNNAKTAGKLRWKPKTVNIKVVDKQGTHE